MKKNIKLKTVDKSKVKSEVSRIEAESEIDDRNGIVFSLKVYKNNLGLLSFYGENYCVKVDKFEIETPYLTFPRTPYHPIIEPKREHQKFFHLKLRET